jgi:hypothetical protein
MNEYPWDAQYRTAMQGQHPDLFACLEAAESKIYDRLEDALQGRQRLHSAEFRAINEALRSLRSLRHDIAA